MTPVGPNRILDVVGVAEGYGSGFRHLPVRWSPFPGATRSWHVSIAKWTSAVGFSDAGYLKSIAEGTRLLTKKEFKELFPDCEIWTERLLILFP